MNKQSKKLQTFRKTPNQTIRFRVFFSSLFDLKSQIEFRILPTSKKLANNISESLKGKKRPREADIDAPTGDFDQIPRLEENLTFSSTLVGLRMMRAQFPNNEKTLRSEKVLRVFKVNTGQDDHAIIFLDNYLCQCPAF
ncbi:uncharacterized protein LOC103958872 isoform X2 [Pyrus x bretschneideri]|uniref:uncharacterized protein LOC103958872 isoform X2 n=1 Tax=Pyrus x bretschneideri TaxID=225117 RepID=UPI00202DC32D|nr:uncharacterized protein LOC103958872 isoform X2 [Pyrus x bretschneideri]XP_048429942.1 uncharacterized protein LOC103958872 isoform X2 [Pyrus x bretschneideri]